MNKLIDQTFDAMCNKYVRLMEYFYPARDSTGFTEQNQVHIYVNSLIEILNDDNAIEWFEFPWDDKRKHIDALVYSPAHETVFYIEAKRFSNKSKANSLCHDIKRIVTADRSFIKRHGIKQFKCEYVIALSDVWLETKWKRSVPFWWAGENLPSQLLKWNEMSSKPLINDTKTFKEFLINEFDVDWSGGVQYAYWLGEKVEKTINYCLLMSANKLS